MFRNYDINSELASDVENMQSLLNTDEAIRERKETAVEINEKTIDQSNIYYFDVDTNKNESIELTPEQATELYKERIQVVVFHSWPDVIAFYAGVCHDF